MAVLILDPHLEHDFCAERDRLHPDNRDEVWEGVRVVAPLANNEHQFLVMRLAQAIAAVVNWEQADQVLPGANVSDRADDWLINHRIPDLVVYLVANPAKNAGTHWVGGPDLAVEVASPGEEPRLKREFYERVNTRELLILDRDPWALELYQLQTGHLVSRGRSDLANAQLLASTVIPLGFQLVDGPQRPTIRMVHPGTGQIWTA